MLSNVSSRARASIISGHLTLCPRLLPRKGLSRELPDDPQAPSEAPDRGRGLEASEDHEDPSGEEEAVVAFDTSNVVERRRSEEVALTQLAQDAPDHHERGPENGDEGDATNEHHVPFLVSEWVLVGVADSELRPALQAEGIAPEEALGARRTCRDLP